MLLVNEVNQKDVHQIGTCRLRLFRMQNKCFTPATFPLPHLPPGNKVGGRRRKPARIPSRASGTFHSARLCLSTVEVCAIVRSEIVSF